MGWRNLKSREMISCDSCHESEELDSDFLNKKTRWHISMTHKCDSQYAFHDHVICFRLLTVSVTGKTPFPGDLESLYSE